MSKRVLNIVIVVTLVMGVVMLVRRSGPRLSYEPAAVERVELLPVVAADSVQHEEMRRLIEPYRDSLAGRMGVVVGRSDATYDVDLPESGLTRLVAEVMLWKADKEMEADVAVSNIGGIRASLEMGDITVGDMYEILPFDNALVVLSLRGSTLDSLAESIALKGGAALAGMSFSVSGDSVCGDVMVGGEPLVQDKVYRVVTSDYLSWGNDGFEPLARYVSLLPMNMMLRDAMLDYVSSRTDAGESVSAPEGRCIGRCVY